jgi:hypothetical protein
VQLLPEEGVASVIRNKMRRVPLSLACGGGRTLASGRFNQPSLVITGTAQGAESR